MTDPSLEFLQRTFLSQNEELRRLKSSDGGGTSGGMEARVAKLEADMEHVKKGVERLVASGEELKKDIAGARERLVAVETKIDALPSKDWITLRLQIYVGMMAAIAAISVAATKLIS